MSRYIAKKILDPLLITELNSYLQGDRPIEGYKEGDPIYTITVKFPDGVEADIKVVNGSGEDSPWGEIVLFDQNGHELGMTEPCLESVDGECLFQVGEDIYQVIVS